MPRPFVGIVMEIHDSVVLITSAGTVLGRRLALHFSAAGAKVVITDRNADGLGATYRACARNGHLLYSYSLPDDSQTSVDNLLSFVELNFPQGIDILINNWTNSPLPNLSSSSPAEEFSARFSDITQALYSYGHACVEQMRRHHKQGVIINVLTNDVSDKVLGTESTCAMVSGLTKSWAKELDPFDIRVGGILPSVHRHGRDDYRHSLAQVKDELVRNTEYIVTNDSFSGRVMSW